MRVRKTVQEYYGALGLAPGASLKEVRRAYLRLVKQWHPDQFAQNPRSQAIAQDKLKEINEAYSFLREYKPGQPLPDHGDGYSWPSGYSRGATEEWYAYRRRAYYEPPIVDPFEGDYQYRPVGNSRGSKFAWIIAVVLVANLAQWGTGWGTYNPTPRQTKNVKKSDVSVVDPATMTVFAAQPADGSTLVRSIPSPLPYFFIGSTKADVYRIQGMPQWSSEHEWRYGTSRVYFRGPMVERWTSTAQFPLKAINLPRVDSEAVIHKGDSSAQVLAIQGTPVSVNDVYWANSSAVQQKDGQISIGKSTYWHYGDSKIELSGDKVVGWTEQPSSPMRVQH